MNPRTLVRDLAGAPSQPKSDFARDESGTALRVPRTVSISPDGELLVRQRVKHLLLGPGLLGDVEPARSQTRSSSSSRWMCPNCRNGPQPI